jgi:phospholipase C
MPPGLDALKHIVVLMMENRSFDHMLGDLKKVNPNIDGLDGTEANQANPDANGNSVQAQAQATYQGQVEPDPGHHFEDVDIQLFWTPNGRSNQPAMQGFVQSYNQKYPNKGVDHSHLVMNYFPKEKVPVLSKLAQKYAVFTRWFSSLPGPTLPNRAFAHFGTSFGNVDMTVYYLGKPVKSIYERMIDAQQSAKIYYFDDTSGSLGMAFMLKNQSKAFGTLNDFLEDCKPGGNLPKYSFIEPNYSDHDDDDGEMAASDQHPDHNVLEGEKFIFKIYNAIRSNPDLWNSTALLILYDEHGGIYDHVVPPTVDADDQAGNSDFKFDRLGVRVPAVLVSPWVPEGTVISDRVFEHASIPATVAKCFIPNPDATLRSSREKKADTFLDFLSLPQARNDPAMTLHLGKVNIFAAQDPSVINLDQTPAGAHNPQREMHQMLWEHVQGMREAEKTLPPDQQTGINIESLKTEADAGNYIKEVTKKLRAYGG